MDRGVYAIVSGAIGQERRMDVVARNLANAQTVGYKRERTVFSSIFAKSVPGGRIPKSQGDKVFSRINGTFLDWKDGSQRMTGNSTDLALEGKGFFVVKTPRGPEYTRSGNFMLNQKRQLVTLDGMPVLGQSGPMTIPPGRLNVDSSGSLTVEGATVDTLRVVQIKDLSAAVSAGARFRTPEKVQPVVTPNVIQGSLEESNVNAIEDFVSMIELSRQYEAAQKVVQAMDDATRAAVNDIARPA
jgi:flagellar basal-body rod protein FlgF